MLKDDSDESSWWRFHLKKGSNMSTFGFDRREFAVFRIRDFSEGETIS